MAAEGAVLVRGGLASTTRKNVMELLAQYWGFLVTFRHVAEYSCNDSRVLSDPNNLAEFFRYIATPMRLGGRGNGRAWVEVRVSNMCHILSALWSLDRPCVPDSNWSDVITWWKCEVGQCAR